jgi:hypothetical protein
MPYINVTSATLDVVKVTIGMGPPVVKVTITATVDKTGIAGPPTVVSQLAKVDPTSPHNPTNVGVQQPLGEITPAGTYQRIDNFAPADLPTGTVLIATVNATITVGTVGDADRTAPKSVP